MYKYMVDYEMTIVRTQNELGILKLYSLHTPVGHEINNQEWFPKTMEAPAHWDSWNTPLGERDQWS